MEAPLDELHPFVGQTINLDPVGHVMKCGNHFKEPMAAWRGHARAAARGDHDLNPSGYVAV